MTSEKLEDITPPRYRRYGEHGKFNISTTSRAVIVAARERGLKTHDPMEAARYIASHVTPDDDGYDDDVSHPKIVAAAPIGNVCAVLSAEETETFARITKAGVSWLKYHGIDVKIEKYRVMLTRGNRRTEIKSPLTCSYHAAVGAIVSNEAQHTTDNNGMITVTHPLIGKISVTSYRAESDDLRSFLSFFRDDDPDRDMASTPSRALYANTPRQRAPRKAKSTPVLTTLTPDMWSKQ